MDYVHLSVAIQKNKCFKFYGISEGKEYIDDL